MLLTPGNEWATRGLSNRLVGAQRTYPTVRALRCHEGRGLSAPCHRRGKAHHPLELTDRRIDIRRHQVLGEFKEQMKKYSTPNIGLISGIFIFTCIFAALTSFRLGMPCFQLCEAGKD